MDLSTLANIAEVFGAIAVVIALVLGYIELHHYQRQRGDVAAFELARSVQSPELIRHFRHILTLPAKPTMAEIRSRDAEESCLALTVAMETYGVMVFRRVVPLDVVDDLMGGALRESWTRLSPYVQAIRAHQGESFGEWAQWLIERLEERDPERDPRPAYVLHRAWRP